MRMILTDELLEDISTNKYDDELIDFVCNKIDDKRAIQLANALKKNSYIKVAYLRDNEIGDAGILALCSVPVLEELDVSNNKFNAIGIKALAKSTLKILNISRNIIGKDIIYFSGNRTLKELHARECEIGNEIAILGEDDSQLEKLLLNHNDIGNLGARGLARIKTLKFLALTYNNITDKNIFDNCKVDQLHLNHNPCTEKEDYFYCPEKKDSSFEKEIVIEETKSFKI